MKRILSLMLCVMMVLTMSITAFASTPWYSEGATVVPGTELAFNLEWLNQQAGSSFTDALDSDDYRVSFDIDHGSGFVANTYIDDDEDLVIIRLKNDYTMYKEREVDGTLELRHKDSRQTIEVPISFVVNNHFDDTSIDFDVPGDEVHLIPDDNTVYEVTDSSSYGTLIFTAEDGSTEVAVRVYEGDRFYLASNENVNKAVVRNNEDVIDVDTDIRFLTFIAGPQFDATATVYFYDTDKDYHVYAIGEDNALTEIGAWDKDEDCIVYKTKTLGSYVICDVELSTKAVTQPPVAGPEADKTNPNTGGEVNPNTGVGVVPNPNTGVDTTGMNIAMAMLGISAVGIAAAVGVKKRTNHN